MEKIKNLLHPHGSNKDRETAGDVTHDHKGTTGTTAQSIAGPSTTSGTTTTSGTHSTPIYDQMTGHGSTSSTTGTGIGELTGLGGERHSGHAGTDGPIGGAHVAGASGDKSTLGDSFRVGDSSRHGDNARPAVSSGTYDGNSEASIKSGVIGFTPGSGGQDHAALPSSNSAEDTLDRNQVVGQGTTGTNTSSGLGNETIAEQPSTLPVSSSTGHDTRSTQQPYDSSRTTDTDRSFPLSGGITSGQHHSLNTHGSDSTGPHDSHLANKADPHVDSDRVGTAGNTAGAGGIGTSQYGSTNTHGTSGLNTNERELGTKERKVASHDHQGREGLAGAAAAAAGTAAATHGHHNDNRDLQGNFSDRTTSPTGHSHLISSVREHNIHPDSLHAAGVRPLNESNQPGHGPPHETPHVNTGTLLDYERAFGSDPHTEHTGLLSYRPQAHRTGTNPHIPGEFPGATPEGERSGPILGGAGTTSETTATGPSNSHDLRNTGSLNDPTSGSSESTGYHLGRDAAVSGGVGAAGLGAAHHRHENQPSGSDNLYDEKSPYSSKALDPRVTGGESRLNEQRFDPAASSSTSRSQPLSDSSTPVVPPKAEERHHHLTRDAAISGGVLGAGALAGSALSGNKQRDSNLHDSSYLPTTQHASGTTNPSTVGTTSTSHHLPSTSTGTHGNPQSQHHYGRDAGLAGAGAATAGGLAHAGSYEQPTSERTLGSTAEDPASKTIGPHKSNIANILDPRVQPDPTKQKDHTTTGPHRSDMLNRADPRVDNKAGQHHYGRDAAVAGGAEAAGYGAHEAANAYGDHRSTQPGAAMQDQRYDPTAAGARAPNPIPASSEYNYHNPDVAALASATGAGAPGHHGSTHGQTQQPYTTAQMAQQASSQPPQALKAAEISGNDLGPKDSSSRNAALGAGAGLAGATAAGYGLSHHDNHAATPGSATQPGSSSLPQPTGSLTQGQQYPYNTDPSQPHTGRNDALAEGAGAGYAYGQRAQPQFDPKEQERLDKETAKRQHDLKKKYDKEVHKLEKDHEKDLKKHEKEAAKHDKEAARHEEKGKSGGLLGFLHRDKSKKDPSPDSTPRRSDEYHQGRDAAVAGGAGVGAAALAEHEHNDRFGHGSGYKGKNLLHKDPPADHPASQALHAINRGGVDGPVGTTGTDTTGRTGEYHYGRDGAVGGGALGAGALNAHGLNKDRTEPRILSSTTSGTPGARENVVSGQHASGLTGSNRTAEHHFGRDAAIGDGALGVGGLAAHELHDKRPDPTSTIVGHTGTRPAGTQQAVPGNTTSGPGIGNRDQHTPAHHAITSGGKREHIGIDGPIGDPNMISGDRQTHQGVYGAHPVEDLAKDHTVIEPRTGLPMNVGRYGDGAGGTDGGPIGHHHHDTVQGQAQPGTADAEHATTNWEDVKKNNTIY